jgi:hypothetical protein
VKITPIGLYSLKWGWDDSAVNYEAIATHEAAAVQSIGDFVWAVEADEGGREIYTLSCYSKKGLVWRNKTSIGPYLCVKDNRCYVVEATAAEQVLADGARLASLRDLGHRMVDGHVERALKVGAPAEALVVVAASVEEAVLRTVREQGVELLVFGSNLRAVEGRAYYGRVVDLAFHEAQSAVLVMG